MIFFRNTICGTDNRVIYFEAIENDEVLGCCTLVLSENFAEVTKLDFDGKSMFIAEGLLKAAYNYAAIKNFYMAKCNVSDIDILLKKLGFQFVSGEYITDIPTILMGSCSNCSGK